MIYKELRDHKKEIIEQHLNGKSIKELCSEYHQNKIDMFDIVQSVYRGSMSKISEAEIEEIQSLYLDGLSYRDIGERMKITRNVVSQCVKRVTQPKHRIYEFNERYFDVIDSQNKAYILGLLYADGTNNTKEHRVSLALKYTDVNILNKISNELGLNKNLEYVSERISTYYGKEFKSQSQYRLRVNSLHFSERLVELGMVPKKSLVLVFPTFLPADLIPHFIRGYFDGDGCVQTQISKTGYLCDHKINILSTNDFCETMEKIIESILGINCHIYNTSAQNGITKQLCIVGRRQCTKFLEWIYKDADLYLDRKYQIYLTRFKY